MPPAREPILCYVTDRRGLEGSPAASGSPRDKSIASEQRSLRDAIRDAVTASVDWIQIREKDLETRLLLELVRCAISDACGTATSILVNDRLDVAIGSGAAGIHLGEDSLPAEPVAEWRRSQEHKDFLIGVSCHSLVSARAAERGGADYVFFGPVFATPSKAGFGAPQGVHRLREICESVKIPVLAIGGVNLENAEPCLAAGAAGIAAIRLFQDAEDLGEVVARLKNQQNRL